MRMMQCSGPRRMTVTVAGCAVPVLPPAVSTLCPPPEMTSSSLNFPSPLASSHTLPSSADLSRGNSTCSLPVLTVRPACPSAICSGWAMGARLTCVPYCSVKGAVCWAGRSVWKSSSAHLIE